MACYVTMFRFIMPSPGYKPNFITTTIIYCNLHEVEDEIHVLFNCTLYSSYRDVFFKKMESFFKTDNKENYITSIFCSNSEPRNILSDKLYQQMFCKMKIITPKLSLVFVR